MTTTQYQIINEKLVEDVKASIEDKNSGFLKKMIDEESRTAFIGTVTLKDYMSWNNVDIPDILHVKPISSLDDEVLQRFMEEMHHEILKFHL